MNLGVWKLYNIHPCSKLKHTPAAPLTIVRLTKSHIRHQALVSTQVPPPEQEQSQLYHCHRS